MRMVWGCAGDDMPAPTITDRAPSVERRPEANSAGLAGDARLSPLGFVIATTTAYCLARSSSMVSCTSSPTTADGIFAAMPNAALLMVVVASNPSCGFLSMP